MSRWDVVTDFVAVGSGGGGLVGAITARRGGSDALVIEKRDVIGGSTARLGGVLWIPNNPLMVAAGAHDSAEAAMAYLSAVVGDVGPASSLERRRAFVANGPTMVSALQQLGVRFVRFDDCSDYYDAEDGSARARSIEGELVDGNVLGPWLEKLDLGPNRTNLGQASYTGEGAHLMYAHRSAANEVRSLRVRARTSRAGRRGVPLTKGKSYVAQLLRIVAALQIPVWTNSSVIDLVVESGRVTGVVVQHEDREIRVGASRGVLLAAGGFAHNVPMRQHYLHAVGAHDHSIAAPGDTGEVIDMAICHKAAVALMDEAVWLPARFQSGMSIPDTERQRPGSVLVTRSGMRFCNEANSYMEIGKRIIEVAGTAGEQPAVWLIFDEECRRRLGNRRSRKDGLPEDWFSRGEMVRSADVSALALACGMRAGVLTATLERFNLGARHGRDHDFGRGESTYNREQGDPKWRPNNCLAPIETPPFYAAPIHLADVGTCGGLLADEHGRVLDQSGDPMPGLYATGGTSATIMGGHYPGAGASFGYASVFGFLAARHATVRRDVSSQ